MKSACLCLSGSTIRAMSGFAFAVVTVLTCSLLASTNTSTSSSYTCTAFTIPSSTSTSTSFRSSSSTPFIGSSPSSWSRSRSSKSSLLAAATLDGSDISLNGLSTNNYNEQQQQQQQQQAEDVKVGVLFLNLGGPEKSDDVEGFLYNLFADPDIIRLPPPLSPLQNLIALFISKRRAPKSIAAYQSIGGGSPILKYSNDQANLITQQLQSKYDLNVSTYIGMRYWYPFTEQALTQIHKDQINALVIVPLYPQFSISTSGSSLRVLQEEFASNPNQYGDKVMTHTVIPAWYDRPGYITAMANIIQTQLNTFTNNECKAQNELTPGYTKHILFSAHGVPQSYIEAGDPYQSQIQTCVDKISKQIQINNPKSDVQVHLSYQSRVGPIEWLRPYTDDVLPQLGNDGVRNLVVVPISFVSEHIETLEEIDIEYRELAEENGISNWRRAPALNTDEIFIEDMADMVYEALNSPCQSVTEACVANNVGITIDGGIAVDDMSDISFIGVGGVGSDADLYQTTSSGGSATTSGTPTSGSGTSNGNGMSINAQESGKKIQAEANERFGGRIAIVAVATAILIELLSGKPIYHLFWN